MPDQVTRIPPLDGWRGIAIALVLFDHVQFALLGDYTRPWTRTGQHGVTIFFVLSGYLITSKLIESPIDLKRFYLRRLFRLMPVAWTYLAAMLLLHSIFHTSVAQPAAILSCLFFYRNYVVVEGGNATGHFWSLSVEEQFYLVWPCVLLLTGLRPNRWIAAGAAISCAFYRFLFWADYDHDIVHCQTQVRADALLVGCLLALILQEPRLKAVCVRWSKAWELPALGILLYCMFRFALLPPLTESVSIAALIATSVLRPNSILSKLLTLRGLTNLGIISYSVYVWQQIFMLYTIANDHQGLALMFIALPLCAYGSYEYIERPSTRLGQRLIRRTMTDVNLSRSDKDGLQFLEGKQ